jgi:hypothetical protein
MYLRTYRRGLGDALTDCLQSFIAGPGEGYNPNFAGNNNPGNLVYVQGGYNYPGAVPGAGGFAAYPDMATGLAALQHQIGVQIGAGQNLTQFFNQYAPGGTVNAAGGVQTQVATNSYVSRAASACGLDTSTPLNQIAASYSGPGSYTPTDSTDSGTGFDLSSLISGFDPSQTYNIAGMVLSGSDLLLLGAVVVGILLISAIL